MRSFALLTLMLVPGCDAGAGSPSGADADPDADPGVPDAAADAGPPAWGPRAVAGRWLAGDFHVHATGASNDTGGDSFPEDIKTVAQARGLDFVVLTDHSNSTGSDVNTRDEEPALFNQGPDFPYWSRAAELSDGAFLMVDGNEISPVADDPPAPRGHVGCYPRDLATFDPGVAFIDRPKGEVSGGQVLAQAREVGCFTTINHPFGPAQWIAYDWTDRGYDALEVWNGGGAFDRIDRQAVDAWLCDLALGHDTRGLGGSDNHRVFQEPPGDLLNPPLGYPTTWVFAADLAWREIVEGLDAGRTSVSDTGAPLEVDVHAADRGWLAMNGGTFAAAEGRFLRIRGELAEDPGEPRLLRVLRVPAGGCDDRRAVGAMTVPVPATAVLLEQPVEAGALEVVLDLADVPGGVAPGDVLLPLVEPDRAGFLHRQVALGGAVRAR